MYGVFHCGRVLNECINARTPVCLSLAKSSVDCSCSSSCRLIFLALLNLKFVSGLVCTWGVGNGVKGTRTHYICLYEFFKLRAYFLMPMFKSALLFPADFYHGTWHIALIIAAYVFAY